MNRFIIEYHPWNIEKQKYQIFSKTEYSMSYGDFEREFRNDFDISPDEKIDPEKMFESGAVLRSDNGYRAYFKFAGR